MTTKEKGWSTRLLIVGFLIFGVTLLLYVGLLFGYRPILAQEINDKKAELTTLSKKVNTAEQDALLRFYSQFANLKSIFKNHVFTSKLFQLFETHTHERTYYTSLNVDTKSRELLLQGITDSYENLAELGGLLEEAKDVHQVMLENAELTNKGVGFKIRMTLSQAFFTP